MCCQQSGEATKQVAMSMKHRTIVAVHQKVGYMCWHEKNPGHWQLLVKKAPSILQSGVATFSGLVGSLMITLLYILLSLNFETRPAIDEVTTSNTPAGF